MKNLYDAVIIGGGPAGLSAAVYLGRAQFKVLVIEKEKIGGQITITSDVVNYPGIIKTTGEELANNMREQAIRFGTEFMISDVESVDFSDEKKVINTDRGKISALSVVIATGASPKRIGFKGEEENQGRGVAYCATCDGEFFTGQDIFVIGGGFAAAEEALFLTKYGRKVNIVVRGENFKCAQSIIDEVMEHEKIEVFFNTELLEVIGDTNLKKAVFKDKKTGEIREYEADMDDGFGVFVFAGYEPASGLFKGKVDLDDFGYVITDENQKTNLDGVYAAGDICIKNLRQVVTAVSDGAIAATSIEKYVSPIQKKLDIKREKKSAIVSSSDKNEGLSNNKSTESEIINESEEFINDSMKSQLVPLFDKFEKNLVLKAYVDDRAISKEVVSFLDEIKSIGNKVSYEVIKKGDEVEQDKNLYFPSIALYDDKNNYLGVQFHGVPGGHEFNSFIVTLYNAAGPGQQIDGFLLNKIKSIDKKINIKVVISLSCTMCPEVVMGAAKVALENKNIEMEMYDMAHFQKITEKYNIKSVPCLIVDDKETYFGKKKLGDIVDIISK